MSAKFINVDLEIESPESLDHVCCELIEAGAFKLYNGKTKGGFLATFEVEDGRSGSDPNSIITTFCDMLECLDERSLKTWSAAHRKTLDIGYETDDAAGSFHSDLKSEVLSQVAELGIDIRLTLYPNSSD
jgi:hypothetical protein